MESINKILDEIEKEWRKEMIRDFPLYSSIPVIKKEEDNNNDSHRYWSFSTDLKSIFITIFDDDKLQKKFETFINKYWDDTPENLAKDTLHYLLFHELYHPLEAPFSISGEDNDRKKIRQAIRRGLLKSNPSLSPLEQIVKVEQSENMVEDFILDNRVYIDNRRKKYFREDIIPVFDVLELENVSPSTDMYTITRLIYGFLYGPESTWDYFKEKAGEEGLKIAEKTLKALLEKEVRLEKTEYESDEDFKQRIQDYVYSIRTIFSSEERYEGIERFISVLEPYIKKGMPKGRSDYQCQNGSNSTQSILQDLLEEMDSEEQTKFIEEIVQGDMEENSEEDLRKKRDIDIFAIHEFYKKNHPKVNIISGKKIGEKIIVGKRQYWHLKKSSVLTEDQIFRLNLRRITQFQEKTGLPMLIRLKNGMYRLNEYELRERSIRDVSYVDSKIDVPEIVEFYIDSSGSMYKRSNPIGFNDGSRWDMLSQVLYGFVDALYQASKKVRKQCNMRIHNFADRQISSHVIPVEKFLDGDIEVLKVLFKPENGYEVENINIEEYNDNKKRAYVIVTDGELVIPNRTEREYHKMKSLSRNPLNEVILFEIGGTYSLGRAVQNDPNIHYYQVHDKETMLQQGLEVLISKQRKI